MPDLANPSSLSSSLNLSRCAHPRPVDSLDSASVKTLAQASEPDRNRHGSSALRGQSSNGAVNVKELADKRKMEPSELQSMSGLPFLADAKKMEKCLTCNGFINYSEELRCTVQGCKGTYHLVCAREILATATPKNFKCPQHVCFVCRRRPNWQCVQCTMASHDKCSAWPDKVVHLKNHPRQAICWRHPSDWLLFEKPAVISDRCRGNILPLTSSL